MKLEAMNMLLPQYLWRENYCGALLSHASSVVSEAGQAVRKISWRTAEIDEGHRSIVTEADLISQGIILNGFQPQQQISFLCEQDSVDPRVLPKKYPAALLRGKTAVVDPIDGTSRFAGHYPDWTVGLGILAKGIPESGVIAAPDANGGMLFLSDYGHGAFLYENGGLNLVMSSTQATPARESVVLFGVDTSLYPSITNLRPEISANVRATYDVGSGLFGLMMVALGRAQAVVQTPQKCWDWVPVYRGVVETGNVFDFFRIEDGSLVPVPTYDFEAFCFDPKYRLGFVAGEPALAQKLFEKLPRSGWGRMDPDTVSGTW